MGNSVAKVPDDQVKEIVTKTGFTKSQGKIAFWFSIENFQSSEYLPEVPPAGQGLKGLS